MHIVPDIPQVGVCFEHIDNKKDWGFLRTKLSQIEFKWAYKTGFTAADVLPTTT